MCDTIGGNVGRDLILSKLLPRLSFNPLATTLVAANGCTQLEAISPVCMSACIAVGQHCAHAHVISVFQVIISKSHV